MDARRASVAHRKRVLPDVALKMAVQKAEPPRNFAATLTRDSPERTSAPAAPPT